MSESTQTPLVAIQKYDGRVKEHSYIVKLKDGSDKQAHVAHFAAPRVGGLCDITHHDWSSDLFHGYAGL